MRNNSKLQEKSKNKAKKKKSYGSCEENLKER